MPSNPAFAMQRSGVRSSSSPPTYLNEIKHLAETLGAFLLAVSNKCLIR